MTFETTSLSGYRWENSQATDDLEIYTLYPVHKGPACVE